jgi:hypothetical protein
VEEDLMGLEIMAAAVAAQVVLELELGLPLRPGSLIRLQLELVVRKTQLAQIQFLAA